MPLRLSLAVLCLALVEATPGVLELNSTEFAKRYAKWQRLYDEAANGVSPATCTNDMRDRMPSCQQFGPMWCWATGVAELAHFYKGSGDSNCTGVECEVVSWCPKPDYSKGSKMDAPCVTTHAQCCPAPGGCGMDGGTYAMMNEAAEHFTGKSHKFFGGPMPQGTLDSVLQSGTPILMIIGHNGTKGSHVTAVGGCGGGSYYYHDPETSVYWTFNYSQLLTPVPLGYSKIWIDTLYPSSSVSITV